MICCSCGKEIDINYGREYWNGIYCKKCADEMLSTPEYIKNYKRIIADLQAENAALRERLDKAVELPAKVMIERTLVDGKFKPTQKAQAFNGRIGVVYKDETRWKGLLVDICSEKTGDYEAAEARLAELKGGKE